MWEEGSPDIFELRETTNSGLWCGAENSHQTKDESVQQYNTL